MAQSVFLIISFGVCYFQCAVAVRKATPCNLQIPFLKYITDANISATSHMYDYTPSKARMSGDGWCAENMCTVGSERQYLQINFDVEVVVEAISIERVDSRRYNYVKEYYVEYGSNESQVHRAISKDSNTRVFNGVDVCEGGESGNVMNFTYPVVTQFVRVVPLEWNNEYPCLRLELYGCSVKECSQIRAISNDNSLLPAENVAYSSPPDMYYENMNISTGLCFTTDMSSVHLTFVEPVYLVYALGSFYYYNNNSFSITYKNSFGEDVTYMNMDGIYSFELTSDEQDQVLLWTPINTTELQLSIHWQSCITVIFYGCTSDEVINHATDKISPAITSSYTVTPVHQQISVITVTTTIQVSATAVITPQSSCSCSGQQQTSTSSSSSDSDVVTIVVPVVVVLGAIIVIVVVIIGVLIWRRTRYQCDTPLYDKAVPTKNDLYGENKNITKIDSSSWKRQEGNEFHETSPSSTKNKSRSECTNPQYVSAGDQQFTVNVDDVNGQHYVDNYLTTNAIVTALKDDPTLTDNPAYVTNTSHPQLADNPAYIAIKHGPPSATTSD